MEAEDIPDDVRRLLQEQIQASETLDMLLVLQRDPTSAWTLDELAHACRVPPAFAAGLLGRLVAAGLVERDAEPGRFGYRPGTPELAAAVEALVRCYEANRVPILKLLTEGSIGRLRGSMARAFADAFLVTRGTGGDHDG